MPVSQIRKTDVMVVFILKIKRNIKEIINILYYFYFLLLLFKKIIIQTPERYSIRLFKSASERLEGIFLIKINLLLSTNLRLTSTLNYTKSIRT